MSCTVAAEKPRRRSSALAKGLMATIVLVTEVPMLAPMIMKTALRTESSFAPTRETMMEVVVEEDCTSTVARIPISMRPETGLSTKSNILAESLPPRSLKPEPIRVRVRRKTQRQYMTRKKRATFFHTWSSVGSDTWPEPSASACF